MKLMKGLSVLLLVTVFSGFLSIASYAADVTIIDVQPNDQSYDMIQWIVNQHIMSITLNKFYPGKYVKRSEFAAIVTKLTGSGTALLNPSTPTFQDVTSKNQFYRQIETAKSYMTYFKSKTGKLFKPDSYLTREDALMSVVKVMGYDSDDAWGSNDNTDISLDDLIEDAGSVNPSLLKYISIGISSGLMDLRTDGSKSYFDPKKSITRKDLAVLIYIAYQKKDYTVEDIDTDSNASGDISGKNNTNGQNSSISNTQPNDSGYNTFLQDKNSDSDKTVTLTQVGQPTLNSSGLATWTDVADAVSYNVQLYCNDIPVGAPVTATSGSKGYNFHSAILSKGNGTYTVRVTAIGAGKYQDGPVSVTSTPFAFTVPKMVDCKKYLSDWSVINIAPDIYFNDMAYGNGLLVGVSGGKGMIYTSSDGSNWQARPYKFGKLLTGIATDGKKFVCVGDGDMILYSADGLNWQIISNNYDVNFESVIYENGEFMAVGNEYNNKGISIFTSKDGITWETHDSVYGIDYLLAYTYGDKYIATGPKGQIVRSEDAEDWENAAIPVKDGIFDVSWNGSSYVAVGLNTQSKIYSSIYTSEDGKDWKLTYSSYDIYMRVSCINNVFFVTGDQGKVLVSNDGVDWYACNTSVTGNILGCISLGDKTIMYGAYGKIIMHN